MAKCISITGTEAEGYTEIKDKDGNLLVAFNSKDAESYWGNEYQKERIKYAMRHRRDNIPEYLRTGEPPPNIKKEAIKLKIKNLLRR